MPNISLRAKRRWMSTGLICLVAMIAVAGLDSPSRYPTAEMMPEEDLLCLQTDALLCSEVLDAALRPAPTSSPTATPAPTATPTPLPTPLLILSTPHPDRIREAAVPPSPTSFAPLATALPVEGCGRIILLINEVRAQNGLAGLIENVQLDAAAQQYADFLAANDLLNHTADRRTLDARAEAAGYTTWIALGENLAGGYSTFEEAVTAWMQSLGHRDNILNPGYLETGVGCAWNEGSSYRSFFVQEFGAP